MSADGGTTWNAIFGPWSVGPCPYPIDFTVDPATGNLWIAGAIREQYGGKKNTTYTTIATVVRLQETASGTWNATQYSLSPDPLLSPEAPDINNAAATAITADAAGHIYVNANYKVDSTSPRTWFVQRFMP